jgi:hypothetical protein
MVTEDFIRQIARDISHKLLAGETARSAAAPAAETLLVFDDEASETLCGAVRAAYPHSEALKPTPEMGGALNTCRTLVLVAPSLDLASKISLLQTDCPTANLVISALLARKRVIAVIEGMLAGRPAADSLAADSPSTGIFRAVDELRAKLSGLGIELITAAEMGRTPEAPPMPVSAVRSAHLPVINPQPTSQHPSRERIHVTDALNEFIDFLQTKQCTMEKGKPCDNCDICNTLGF